MWTVEIESKVWNQDTDKWKYNIYAKITTKQNDIYICKNKKKNIDII